MIVNWFQNCYFLLKHNLYISLFFACVNWFQNFDLCGLNSRNIKQYWQNCCEWFQILYLWSETVAIPEMQLQRVNGFKICIFLLNSYVSQKYKKKFCELFQNLFFVVEQFKSTMKYLQVVNVSKLYLCCLNSHLYLNNFCVLWMVSKYVSLFWTVMLLQFTIFNICELVSKFCIFVVWNSKMKNYMNFQTVVNWFQNFVSLWSETVFSMILFVS